MSRKNRLPGSPKAYSSLATAMYLAMLRTVTMTHQLCLHFTSAGVPSQSIGGGTTKSLTRYANNASGCLVKTAPNMALNLAPFGRWTLRHKAAQRRLAPGRSHSDVIDDARCAN